MYKLIYPDPNLRGGKGEGKDSNRQTDKIRERPSDRQVERHSDKQKDRETRIHINSKDRWTK